MIERHQDYIIGGPLHPFTIPIGGITDVALKLDPDAPFALRLVRSRNIGLSGWRFQTPRRLYQSNALRTDVLSTILFSGPANVTIPQPGRGVVIYPQMVYPADGTIVIDFGNTTGAPIENAQLLFRGSKLYADGAIPAPSYPPTMSVLPFIYHTEVNNVPVSGPQLVDNQLRIRSDADFVFKYGVADPFFLGVDGGPVNTAQTEDQIDQAALAQADQLYTEVYVTLRDEGRKAYSNGPIHINDLFGQGMPKNVLTPFPAIQQDNQVLFFPGLLTPQIYLPKEHSLYFDVIRRDTAGFPINLYFRFSGEKVFHR